MDADDGGERGWHDRSVDDVLAGLFRNTRVNAVVAWALVGVLALVAVESALDVDYQWLVFVATAGVVVLLPPVAVGDWRVMLPWELLALALLPILVRGLFGGELGTFGYYLSLAGLALLVAVELHMFTELRLTHWFAVVLVVMTTMAMVAGWSVVRWNMDLYLGTDYLGTNEDLMAEWIAVTAAGIVAGILFDSYFRGRGRRLRRSVLGMIRR